MKAKGEITYIPNTTIREIKTAVHIISAIAIIVCIIGIVVCAKYIRLGIDYEALNKEKQALEDLTEMQSSMISDLEENCKDLFIEIERLRYE